MKHLIGLITATAAFWLLLSGHYTGLLLSLGALSIALVAWLAHRMDVVDNEAVPLSASWRLPLYWLWLGKEVLLASFDTIKRIYGGPKALDPALRTIRHNQPSELNTVLYANSITLTPGTMSVRVTDDSILIHTVNAELLDGLEDGEMAQRAKATQRGDKGQAE